MEDTKQYNQKTKNNHHIFQASPETLSQVPGLQI